MENFIFKHKWILFLIISILGSMTFALKNNSTVDEAKQVLSTKYGIKL